MSAIAITPIAQAAHEHCLSLRRPSVWDLMPAWEHMDINRPWRAGEVAKLAVGHGGMRFTCLEQRIVSGR